MDFKNIFSLSGKNVLITGGAGYFGKRFVQGLLDFGARVIIVEKASSGHEVGEKLSEVKERFLKDYPDHVAWYETDLYDEAMTDAVYDKILVDEGHVDVLVNNAFEFGERTGFTTGRKETISSSTHEEFHLAFESGIWWAQQAIRKFGPEMKKRGKGNIINIASALGVVAPSPFTYEGFVHSVNPPAYSVIKSALLSQTRYSAAFLAPEVRVNALSPGAIPNLGEDSRHNRGKEYKDGFLDNLAKRMVLQRCGEVDELVAPLIFLASDASSYISGHNLLVDGGWTVT